MKITKYFLPFFVLLVVCSCSDNSDNGEDGTKTDDPEYFRAVTGNSSKWIYQIVEYHPAPGQFINASLGTPDAAQSIVGKKGLVSLGAFGGYIIFKFDHTVVNRQGYDFVIHGNAFGVSSEPGIVMVAADINRNGMPDDDEWYELAGSETGKSGTTQNYSITYLKPSQTNSFENVLWEDSQGQQGAVHAHEFYDQSYYPLFLGGGNSLTYSGVRLADNGSLEGNLYVLAPLKWGYADNYDDEYTEIVGTDQDTKNSNKFDIDNAIDNNGMKVNLKGIDFIKVYTAVNQENGYLGETSTEVCGAISLTVQK